MNYITLNSFTRLFKSNFERAIAVRLSLVSLIFLLLATGTDAQSLEYDKKKKMITVGGTPVAKMYRKKGDMLGINKNFDIQSLEGEKLIFFKFYTKTRVTGRRYDNTRNRWVNEEESTIWYEITFIPSGNKVNMKRSMGLSAKGVLKLLQNNRLIKDNKINPEGETNFININNGSVKKQVAVAVAPIIVRDNEIFRDDEILGQFTEKKSQSEDAQQVTKLNIYSSSGEKIAIAERAIENPEEWLVTTPSDDKTTEILYDADQDKEGLFEWLVDKGYL
jgi:hypothetical protein